MQRFLAFFIVSILFFPLIGSLELDEQQNTWLRKTGHDLQVMKADDLTSIPEQWSEGWNIIEVPWWERTALDENRNQIHDQLENVVGTTGIGVSYKVDIEQKHIDALNALGLESKYILPSVDALLLGHIDASYAAQLASLEDVAMVEMYGQVVFYGDVQTPAVKAMNSSVYPNGAWDLGVSGEGVVIAMVDTGVDNEHPGLNQKFVAGFDAVCYVHSDPTCAAQGGRETDGTYDPDDGNQHGTACMGMASATGLDANGEQTDFYGSAPDAALVDVRIGTDLGAGPFENYLISQEFYESAMNGLQWIIDHKDDAWQGADESVHGIDIISLSWGITSHEGGGSDGEDMHSRILDEAMEAGIVVSVAAGNDGPDNDGLSGMGSSSLSITVGATDDKNTVDRTDDTIAGYSSRGDRRDNNDGNPLNELKPEVTAPGTNIIQAEGCVTSGLCNNFFGGDASENGYTGRGSGTSYATPAVSGILALMIEANPDLSTAEMKEILKLTAERRGEPSAPDIDPYWNRDFGWGMVDAYEAVSLAIHMRDAALTGEVDVSSQVHITNISVDQKSSIISIEGMSWGQSSAISMVEGRIGTGMWMEATYETLENSTSFYDMVKWRIALDAKKLANGNFTLEIRAVNEDGVQSLPVFATVENTMSSSADESSVSLRQLTMFFGVLVVLVAVAVIQLGRTEQPLLLDDWKQRDEVLEAELIE
jgi:subtilisin family serine protease